ncbi:DUF1674 domain-containing protein [Geminicoccaceae bacterium 1502E]|nr:DUF1674 domain-containing protein [Geminicoccaceae bacterium 1502E]
MSEQQPKDRGHQPPPAPAPSGAQGPQQPAGEVNGPKGPEPTRFGDWEKDGRCSDF